jgi:hypothetical protein
MLQLMITYCLENSDNLIACAHRSYRECLRLLMNTGREQLLERVFVDTQRRKKRTSHTLLFAGKRRGIELILP